MSKKKEQEEAPDFVLNLPTNRYASKRPYCTKHGRAMLDIGGEKKCPGCVAERRGQPKASVGGERE